MPRDPKFKSDSISKTIGENLRRIRKSHGLTLEDLDGITNLAAFHISRLERGESSANARTILKLCKGLKVKPNALFKGLI